MKRTRFPGHSVPLEFKKLRVIYPGHLIPFGFKDESDPPEPWVPPAGDNIIIDFGGELWTPPVGDGIFIDFGKTEEPVKPPLLFHGPIESYEGAAVELNLATFQTLYVNEFVAGENLSVDVNWHTASDFETTFWTGENLSVDVNFTSTLHVNPFHAGENLSVDISWHEADILEVNFWAGENLGLALSTTSNLDAIAYTGENLATDVSAAPSEPIPVEFYVGEHVVVETIATAVHLVPEPIYSGEHATVSEIDSLENFLIYAGEALEASLATDTLLEPEGVFSGENLSVEVRFGPSEYMGTFRAYAGENLEVPVPTYLISKRFEVRFAVGEQTTGYWTGSPYVDTIDLSGWPDRWEDQWVQMDLADDLTTNFEGLETYCVASLSTRSRFQLSFATGEAGSLGRLGENAFDEGYSSMGAGENLQVSLDTVYNVYLCLGNFIPDADSVDVELLATELELCQDYTMLAGERMVSSMSAQYSLYPLAYTGEYVVVDLFIDPTLRCTAYTGENLRWFDPYFEPMVRTGEHVTFRFEEPDYEFFTGENVLVESLTIEYNVWFLEAGCLPNEYIPTTESGDLDYDKFNPVPIELDHFRHEIRAMCG